MLSIAVLILFQLYMIHNLLLKSACSSFGIIIKFIIEEIISNILSLSPFISRSLLKNLLKESSFNKYFDKLENSSFEV